MQEHKILYGLMALLVFGMEFETTLELVSVLTSKKAWEPVFKMVLELPLAGNGSQKACAHEIL